MPTAAPPGRIIRLLICTLKGGPGKTTTAWFLSLAFAAKRGLKVVAVDADLGSRTLTSWNDRAVAAGDTVPFIVHTWHGPNPDGTGHLSGVLKRLEHEHGPDVLIVDTGGEQRQVFMSACLWADWLIMPTGPALAEIERLHESKAIAAEIAEQVPLMVSVLLTRVPPQTAEAKANSTQGRAALARALIANTEPEASNDFNPYALHVLETTISNNGTKYAQAFGYVTDDPGEYDDLADELLTYLNQTPDVTP